MGRLGRRAGAVDVKVSGADGPMDPPDDLEASDHRGQSVQQQLSHILTAIKGTRESLEGKIDSVAQGLDLLKADHNKLKGRVVVIEKTLLETQPRLKSLDSRTEELEERVKYLEGRAEDAEGRNRRSNLRIVGLPEGAEGSDPAQFLETWIKSFMPVDVLTSFFTIERAHRVPGRRPPPGSPPRPVLAKLLHFRDRDAILRVARARAHIQFENTKVLLFPDYTAAVQQQRRSFNEVKAKLRDMNLQYALIFPARLKINIKGRFCFFDDAQSVWDWLESKGETGAIHDMAGWEARPRRKRRGKGAQPQKKKANLTATPPSPAKSQEERERVLAVAAALRHRGTTRDTDGSESESDGASLVDSLGSVAIGPVVTPQTADLL